MRRLDTEEFIEKCKKFHGERYDYSLVQYKNWNTNVTIICQEHGIYNQLPHNHLAGSGCKKCGKKFTSDIFIKKSNIKHQYKYDYSNVVYAGCRDKVTIICPIHGSFTQTPYTHLQGHGCFSCMVMSHNKDTEYFIKKSKDIHGNLYDYSNTKYIDNKSVVIIGCKIHGNFKQTPNSHISGSGCPYCNISKGELLISNMLDIKGINYKRQYKFADLSDKYPLKFDFAIMEGNKVKYLIEFNGRQHYEYTEYFHKNIDNFISSQYRDNMKKEYCDINHINLCIIKYNESIKDKLSILINTLL